MPAARMHRRLPTPPATPAPSPPSLMVTCNNNFAMPAARRPLPEIVGRQQAAPKRKGVSPPPPRRLPQPRPEAQNRAPRPMPATPNKHNRSRAKSVNRVRPQQQQQHHNMGRGNGGAGGGKTFEPFADQHQPIMPVNAYASRPLAPSKKFNAGHYQDVVINLPPPPMMAAPAPVMDISNDQGMTFAPAPMSLEEAFLTPLPPLRPLLSGSEVRSRLLAHTLLQKACGGRVRRSFRGGYIPSCLSREVVVVVM